MSKTTLFNKYVKFVQNYTNIKQMIEILERGQTNDKDVI